MKGFEFEKALMQEHFNESYVESEKFPKTSFKGSIENFKSLDLSKDGTYDVTVSGDIDLHGISKNYKTQGTITKKGDKMDAKAKFNIKVADHNVKIPAGKLDNISEIVEITVDMNYAPYGK
jgi:polyisoprenoid-binding protein YceI